MIGYEKVKYIIEEVVKIETTAKIHVSNFRLENGFKNRIISHSVYLNKIKIFSDLKTSIMPELRHPFDSIWDAYTSKVEEALFAIGPDIKMKWKSVPLEFLYSYYFEEVEKLESLIRKNFKRIKLGEIPPVYQTEEDFEKKAVTLIHQDYLKE